MVLWNSFEKVGIEVLSASCGVMVAKCQIGKYLSSATIFILHTRHGSKKLSTGV